MLSADLELTLLRRDGGAYSIDLRLADPASETGRRLSSSTPIRFDDEALRKLSQDPAAYGRCWPAPFWPRTARRALTRWTAPRCIMPPPTG